MAKPPGTKPRATHEELDTDARRILHLKGEGHSRAYICKKMGLSPQNYDTRIQWIRDNDLLRLRAVEFVDDTIERLFSTRQKVRKLANKHAKNFNSAGTALYALKMLADIDGQIADVADQLKWLTPPEKKHEFHQDRKYEGMSLDELETEYNKALNGVNKAKLK